VHAGPAGDQQLQQPHGRQARLQQVLARLDAAQLGMQAQVEPQQPGIAQDTL